MTVGERVEARARRSRGVSSAPIYDLVVSGLEGCGAWGGVLVDVGCGEGALWPRVASRCSRYIGVDAVRYEDYPDGPEFIHADFDSEGIPLPEGSADVVVAVEVIEHLENPRSFARELVRVAKPGGWVLITTPNQLSLLSILTLITRARFGSFQDVDYPAHLTALLEVDLHRILQECGLVGIRCEYSCVGRMPLTRLNYPRLVARRFPRACSDNLLVLGRKRGA